MKSLLRFAAASAALALLLNSPARAWNSAKVQYDTNGRLTYPADANGYRIADFSNAGYKGGGVPLPTIPVVRTVSPIAGDNTANIQAAIDAVGAMAVQPNGYRGAVLLSAGTYLVNGTLRLGQSGVVLSGVGDGTDPATNTVLQRTGTSLAEVIIAGSNTDDSFKTEIPSTRSNITDSRVQVGSRSFNVDNASLYQVGDAIVIWHPSTQAWIDAVDKGGVTDTNIWQPGQIDIRYCRTITAISGTTITVDAPVFTNLDRSLSQSIVYKYDRTGKVTNVGIEDIFVDVVTNGPTSEDHCEDVITFVGVEDCWIRDCTMQHFVHAGVQFGGTALHCTAERCRAIDPNSIITGERRYNFCTYHAQLVLFQDCFASFGRHSFVCNGTSSDSGVVFLNGTIDNPQTFAEPHRRWSQGILYDGIVTTNRGTDTDVLGLYNRGNYGTGHGWAAAHSIMWRCDAAGGRILVQQPPTAQNYAIGCFGNVTGSGPWAGAAGYFEGTGTTGLVPASLYQEQLLQRQGVVAPTFAPGGGTYTTVQNVTIATTTSGASIRYTLDGSTPTSTSGNVYTGPVAIASTATLKAIAYRTGWPSSAVTSAVYTINLPTASAPTFSPVAGTYTGTQSVTLSSNSGTSIRYTTDGSTPTRTVGTVYAGPISVAVNTTIKAIAYGTNFLDSSVSSATYNIRVAAPTFSPGGGTYSSAPSVTIATSTSGASVRFTIDGTTPSPTVGTLYSGPVTIASSCTLKAIAYKTGMTDSTVTTATYTVSTGTTIDSTGGFFNRTLGAAQSGLFTVEFDASVSVSPSNTNFSLCQGNATAYTGLACMVRFNPTGTIDARNGGVFAAVNALSFTANTSYHIRMDVNVPTHTYSVYVTPAGGSAVTIATDYAFRTEQAAVTSLDTFDVNVNATPGGSATFGATTVKTVAKLSVPAASVTASADDGNVSANTVDGNLATRWSASGDGQWIRFDLGATKNVSQVKVAFYSGNTRSSTFDVQVSSDGTNFTTVASFTSSGTTTALENFEIPDKSTRYVRLLGHGNSANAWNSYTEVEIWGY